MSRVILQDLVEAVMRVTRAAWLSLSDAVGGVAKTKKRFVNGQLRFGKPVSGFGGCVSVSLMGCIQIQHRVLWPSMVGHPDATTCKSSSHLYKLVVCRDA